MNNFRLGGFNILPVVTKNLLIINGLIFFAQITLEKVYHYDLGTHLGLFYFGSSQFMPIQFISYMFLHGSFSHLFMNMFAFWMFGSAIENYWGPKRFLTYYMITGIGAGLIQQLVAWLRISGASTGVDPLAIQQIANEGFQILDSGQNFVDPGLANLNVLYNMSTIGASGSVFGILLAFGMMFPNALIYLYFAIPVKAKWFVLGYGAVELYSGFANQAGDHIAHFAHLGGMLFGFILIKYWKNKDLHFKQF
ncbi:MAG: rhomboid family intramembrane serine protease [Bacteroidales bacterium]|nr:rhomboid family intramembrane serine protease [Bacteroidales bacterium]